MGPFCPGTAARSIRFTAARSTIRRSFLHAGEGARAAVVRSTMLVVKGAGSAVRQQCEAAGLAAAGSTPKAFRDMVRSSCDKIAQIVKMANTPFTA